MRPNRNTQNTAPRPLVVRDHSRFVSGFVAGLLLISFSVGVVYLMQKRRARLGGAENLVTVLEIEAETTQLAIERAEEINIARTKYVDTCGLDLADVAWREAGGDDRRYELLSTFIPFSPPTLEEYMPEDFELVLWENLEKARNADPDKVQLLVGGTMIEY